MVGIICANSFTSLLYSSHKLASQTKGVFNSALNRDSVSLVLSVSSHHDSTDILSAFTCTA